MYYTPASIQFLGKFVTGNFVRYVDLGQISRAQRFGEEFQ